MELSIFDTYTILVFSNFQHNVINDQKAICQAVISLIIYYTV